MRDTWKKMFTIQIDPSKATLEAKRHDSNLVVHDGAPGEPRPRRTCRCVEEEGQWDAWLFWETLVVCDWSIYFHPLFSFLMTERGQMTEQIPKDGLTSSSKKI